MAAQLKVIAFPDDDENIGGNDLDTARKAVKKAAPGAGYTFIEGYSETGDLIAQLKDILKANPQKCLTTLEIVAHSNPEICNGLEPLTIGGFGKSFMKLRLCDNVEIYLSGCNTGLVPPRAVLSSNRQAVAKQLVDTMPYNASTFPVHVTVYGTLGYMLQGTSGMQGNPQVQRSYRHGGVDYPIYPGSKDANGNANAYQAFKNW